MSAKTDTNALSLADHVEMLCRISAHPHFVPINKVTAIEIVAALRACDELVAGLRDVLNTREIEARTRQTADVAVDNYVDPRQDVDAAADAMVAASEAERKAKALLAKHAKPDKGET